MFSAIFKSIFQIPDVRLLQDLITAEKAVLTSMQKLSMNYAKAAKAMRTFGSDEGDDLGEILSASTTMLNHFLDTLSEYAADGLVRRQMLKSIRTRKENLHRLRTKRQNAHDEAEGLDKKIRDRLAEGKCVTTHEARVSWLRGELIKLEGAITMEEAALADFTRITIREWMELNFHGLSECCRTGIIIAEFGKMIISDISEPGGRYYGHGKTESYVSEAKRCLKDLTLTTVPPIRFRDRRELTPHLQTSSLASSFDIDIARSGKDTPGGAGERAKEEEEVVPVAVSEDALFDCAICLESLTVKDIANLEGCNHLFCRNCLREYIKSMIKSRRYPIACPVCLTERTEHPSLADEGLFQVLGLSDEYFAIFTDMQLSLFSLIITCRRCTEVMRVDRMDYEASEYIECPSRNCNYVWCKNCSQQITANGPHHSCDGSSEFDYLVKTMGWKYCPGCKIAVKKEEGCNHMICSSPGCNTHFCYACGELIIRGHVCSL